MGDLRERKGYPGCVAHLLEPKKYTHTHQWTLAQIASPPSIRMGFRVKLWVEDMVHVQVMKKRTGVF